MEPIDAEDVPGISFSGARADCSTVVEDAEEDGIAGRDQGQRDDGHDGHQLALEERPQGELEILQELMRRLL